MPKSLIAKDKSMYDIIDTAYRQIGGPAVHPSFAPVSKEEKDVEVKHLDVTAKDILEFVPVIGDILAAEEVYKALQESPVDWKLVGILTAGTAVGLIPGIGDAAAKAIKAGGKAVLDGSKKAVAELKKYDLEIDPSTLGMSGGNIKIVKKKPSDGMEVLDFMASRKREGWNYSGKPDSEFQSDLIAYEKKREKQKFMTDAERDLDNEGLSDVYEELIGISSPDDIRVAKEIADLLDNPSKGNYPQEMLIKEILDKADHSTMSLSGLTQALATITKKSPEETLALIMKSK